MSMNKNKQQSKAKKVEEAKKRAELMSNNEEPVWEFSDEDDVATIVGKIIFETITLGASINMLSYNNIVNETSLDINKSNFTVLIAAAVMQRLDMTVDKNNMLANSDNMSNMFTAMKLDDKVVNNLFVNMIMTLCPELIKQIEIALIASISRNSRKVVAKHTETRLLSSFNNLMIDNSFQESDMKIARSTAMQKPIVMKDRLIGSANVQTISDDEEIMPEDSISNESKRMRKKQEAMNKINEKSLMNYVVENKRNVNSAKSFEDTFKPNKKPIEATNNVGRSGIGFKAAANKQTLSEKMSELQEDLLDTLQDHQEEELKYESDTSVL